MELFFAIITKNSRKLMQTISFLCNLTFDVVLKITQKSRCQKYKLITYRSKKKFMFAVFSSLLRFWQNVTGYCMMYDVWKEERRQLFQHLNVQVMTANFHFPCVNFIKLPCFHIPTFSFHIQTSSFQVPIFVVPDFNSLVLNSNFLVSDSNFLVPDSNFLITYYVQSPHSRCSRFQLPHFT